MTHRRALYAGAFLVTAGAVMLLGRGDAEREAIHAALGLWPIAIVAIGLALIVRHTRLGLAVGLLAAVLPGMLAGGVVAASPRVEAPGCGAGTPDASITRDGSFSRGTATARISISCGELSLTTGDGIGWHVDADSGSGRPAEIRATDELLEVISAPTMIGIGRGAPADRFTVILPRDVRLELAAEINAGRGTLDLAGAALEHMALEVNAGDVRVDLTGATVDSFTFEANAADLALLLPVTPGERGDGNNDGNSDGAGIGLIGAIDANAASVEVCVPDGLAVRITGDSVLGSITTDGLVRRDGAWESPDYPTATSRADLNVSVNVGSVHITAEGGCA